PCNKVRGSARECNVARVSALRHALGIRAPLRRGSGGMLRRCHYGLPRRPTWVMRPYGARFTILLTASAPPNSGRRTVDQIAVALLVRVRRTQTIGFRGEVVRAFCHVLILMNSTVRRRCWPPRIATCRLRTALTAWRRPRLRILWPVSASHP